MIFYSTNNRSKQTTIEDAIRQGLASDRGLFMPESIPALPSSFIEALPTLSTTEIAVTILQAYVNEIITKDELTTLCDDAFSFDAPLVEVEENIFALELYHGPTLAFKDFGARFMARLIGHLNTNTSQKNTILVATSGDTGSAVASGFFKVENTEVVILYPKGKVSDLQEKQMTTLGANIHAIKVNGNFDDCQRLVKEAFVDAEIAKSFGLTSANSINLARLLPQMLYYFVSYGQLVQYGKPVVYSVPSGNYGNLTAGLIAQKMGLPIHHFIAASNANKIVPDYLHTGDYLPKPSIETISNAMDVGDPSNYVRMKELFNDSLELFRKHISGFSYSDDETRAAIKDLYQRTNYLSDPHGAIGYLGLKEYLQENEVTGVFLETAHPIKFRSVVEPIIGKTLPVPKVLEKALRSAVKSVDCQPNYNEFVDCLKRLLV